MEAGVKVVHLDSERGWRGGQRQAWMLMRGLRERGVACALLAPAGPLLHKARADGIEAREWSGRGDADLVAVWKARSILRRLRPDLVHCHSGRAHALGVPAARLAGVPRVVVSRRVAFPPGRHPFAKLKYGRGVDLYLCISEAARRALLDAGIPAERLALVPSGVPLAPPRPSGAGERPFAGVPPGARIVGTVAALEPDKNALGWLEASAQVCERMQDVHFVWIGEGRCRGRVERMRSTLGLERRVHLAGFRDEPERLLASFDVYVLPSWSEGLNTSLLDAMVAGVPVVASRTGGVPEIVEDGVTGRLVDPGRPDSIAAGILEALDDRRKAAGWVEAGRQRAANFSEVRMVEGTLEAYARVLGRGTRGRD
jgi:glycosyltransferase involved in cell wall biosynthesis